jgi:uncharacterized repeat protein (TIGR04138 family)
MKSDPRQKLIQAIRADGRYPPEAYEFLHQGLEHTSRALFGDESSDEPRHVSGQDLARGLRELALRRWGPLAPVVLRKWNIRGTRDFGEMVFFLIDLGLMGKQDVDRIEDFDDVYDFNEAFDNYEVPPADDEPDAATES